MKTTCRGWRAALLGGLALFVIPNALAQSATPVPPPNPDAHADAQKSAFLAMPEADRKAVQDALGWLGLYNGAVDGAWGKRTRDSVVAYQATLAGPADGLVTAAQLAALKAAARKARAAVGFEIVDERRSGVRLGAPLKILTKIAMVGADATLETPDGAVTLALQIRTGDTANLAALYAKLISDANGRKVTYKAIKPDEFFVVAGEEGARKFYTRFAKSPADWADGLSLRGFTFSYPIDQAAEFDKVALAITNAFEPFSSSATGLDTAAARASSAPITLRDIVKQPWPSDAAAAPAPPSDAGAKPPAPGPETIATGLAVAPGQVLTAAADCGSPSVDGKPAKIARSDATSGLALLTGDFAPMGAPPTTGAPSNALIVLSYVALASGKATLEASTATLAAGEGSEAIVAALTKSASGAPVFDRRGDLTALVAPIRSEPARVGGVALAQPHGVIAADALARFLGQAPGPAAKLVADLSAGDLARAKRAMVVEVVCRP